MWLRGQLRRRGPLALAISRLVPVGSFAVMSLVAGALRAPFHWFLLGTAVGLLPGILVLALFIDRVGRALRDPGAASILGLLVVLLLVGGGLWWLGRRLGRGGGVVAAPAPGTGP
jgi:phospholipase D1/2